MGVSYVSFATHPFGAIIAASLTVLINRLLTSCLEKTIVEGIYKGENSESSTEALQHLIREGHEVNIWEFSQQLEPLVKASNLEQPKKEAIIRKAKSKETRAKNVIEKINNIDEGK
jgi:hypothetical protein